MLEESMSERNNELKLVLSRLKGMGVESSAIVRRDGVMITAEMTLGEEQRETFAAMSAAMLGAAETAVSEMKQGIPRRIVLEIGGKKLIAQGAGPVVLLVALVGPKADVPRIYGEIDKAAIEVRKIIKQEGR
ncbi:distant relative of homeotic protein bithoraxoid [Methanocella sp. CWC-04]|uniref:Distant relative of homeotic protein bithoraxoid n=1 Tax=Methanooceanicella nereidis TaxID=2052831 RepID=A0AAP2RDE6_9EURY|nr:roadblock/LC7 domain-containing protein [Methanocella sp. CWC-04]MCD1295458.1 distant relative of homeotic protein bithoraxoid [Methanocella sp. CWC-04]